MSGKENVVMRKIMLALGQRPDTRVFRNNIGVAVFPDGSRVAYGLAPGSSDIIGWTRIEITPDMVGQKVAVFVAVEVKQPGNNRATEGQINFIEAVRSFGGRAGIAHSPEEALKIILNKGDEPTL